jgi:hypothetical protein
MVHKNAFRLNRYEVIYKQAKFITTLREKGEAAILLLLRRPLTDASVLRRIRENLRTTTTQMRNEQLWV